MSTRIVVLGCLIAFVALPAAAQLDTVYWGQHVPLAPGPNGGSCLVGADVNQDGVVDLISSGSLLGAATAFTVLRKPQGGFGPPVSSPLAGGPIDLVAGDLDGDPWPDLAGVTLNQRIVVAHGVGDGSFVNSAQYFTGNGVPRLVAIGDVNHDGLNDVLSGLKSGLINVNLADGAGGYLATQAWQSGAGITSMVLTDLDGNGWLDVLTTDDASDQLSIVRGDGSGGFLGPQLMATAGWPGDVLAGDLNGDADMDALVTGVYANPPVQDHVQPYLGDGLGGLQAGLLVDTKFAGVVGALHDLDLDGDLDALVFGAALGVLVNDGAAHFTVSTETFLFSTNSQLPARMVLTDASGDGLVDVVVGTGDGAAAVIPSKAPTVFAAGGLWYDQGFAMTVLATGNVTGDEWPDVVIGTAGDPSLVTLKATSSGLDTNAPVHTSGFEQARDVRLGDLGGDGRADVIVSPWWSTNVLQVGRGLGTGAFDPPQTLTWPGSAEQLGVLQLPDVDGDGWLDIVGLVTGSSAKLVSFVNSGPATSGFGPAHVQALPGHVHDLAAGDLDGDGLEDVVLSASGATPADPASLRVFFGDSAGQLIAGPASVLPTPGFEPIGLTLGDLDLDGRLDAVAGRAIGSGFLVALGDGAGGFLGENVAAAQPGAKFVKIGDVNGDGWPDVVHASSETPVGNGMALRLGVGQGELGEPQLITLSPYLNDFTLLDLAHDGRPWLLAASQNVLLWLPNIAETFTWKDHGFALAGATGKPELHGTGELLTGTPGFVRLTRANPSAPCALFASPTATPTPFKGGMLVPVPPVVAYAMFTDAHGRLDIPWLGWPGSHPGQSWYFQFGVQDSGGPHGAALSNAISGTEP